MSKRCALYHDPWPEEPEQTITKGDPPIFTEVKRAWANSDKLILKLRRRRRKMDRTNKGTILLENKKGYKLAIEDSWKLIKVYLVPVVWLAGFTILTLLGDI